MRALAGGSAIICTEGLKLPADAEVIAVNADFARASIVALITSETFPAVPEGELPPFVGDASTKSALLYIENAEAQAKVEAEANGLTYRGKGLAFMSRLELVAALRVLDREHVVIATSKHAATDH